VLTQFQPFVAPFIPLLFHQEEELPFDFLLVKSMFFSVPFNWRGLETFGEQDGLFSPFSGFWREGGRKEG